MLCVDRGSVTSVTNIDLDERIPDCRASGLFLLFMDILIYTMSIMTFLVCGHFIILLFFIRRFVIEFRDKLLCMWTR